MRLAVIKNTHHALLKYIASISHRWTGVGWWWHCSIDGTLIKHTQGWWRQKIPYKQVKEMALSLKLSRECVAVSEPSMHPSRERKKLKDLYTFLDYLVIPSGFRVDRQCIELGRTTWVDVMVIFQIPLKLLHTSNHKSPIGSLVLVIFTCLNFRCILALKGNSWRQWLFRMFCSGLRTFEANLAGPLMKLHKPCHIFGDDLGRQPGFRRGIIN